MYSSVLCQVVFFTTECEELISSAEPSLPQDTETDISLVYDNTVHAHCVTCTNMLRNLCVHVGWQICIRK